MSMMKTSSASAPPENLLLRRLRHRRLVSFLSLPAFDATFQALIKETDVFFSEERLRGLVRQGMWDDALAYLSRFLPPASKPWSPTAHGLFHYIRYIGLFAKVAAGDKAAVRILTDDVIQSLTAENKRYRDHGRIDDDGKGAAWLRYIILCVLQGNIRSSLDWGPLRGQSAFSVLAMSSRTPELKQLRRFPKGSTMLPVPGLRLGRKRRAKMLEPRPHPKAAAAKLSRAFCGQYVRPWSPISDSTYTVGLSPTVQEKLAIVLGTNLECAKHPNTPDQYLTDGAEAWVFPFTHRSPTKLTVQPENDLITEAEEWIYPYPQHPDSYIARPVVSNCRAPVSKAMKLTSHGKITDTLGTNADASGPSTLHTNLGMFVESGVPSLTNGGTHVTPISQDTIPSKNIDASSLPNDSPALGNISQHAKNSGVSSSTWASSMQLPEGCQKERVQKYTLPFEQKFTGTTMAIVPETDAEDLCNPLPLREPESF